MAELDGKVAVITGGASGIGLAMARSLSAAGMKVAITDVEQAALDRVKDSAASFDGDVIHLQLDVTDRDALEQAARETEAAFGKIHVVCNNAGVAGNNTTYLVSFYLPFNSFYPRYCSSFNIKARYFTILNNVYT